MTLQQRSNTWRQMRLGDVTASRFGDCLTAASATGVFSVRGSRGDWAVFKGDEQSSGSFERKSDAEDEKREQVDEWRKTHWSATAESYLNEKLTELIHCKPADTWRADSTDWGTENEPLAFEASIPVIAKHFGEHLDIPEGENAYIHHVSETHIGCSPDGIIGDDGLAEIKCPYNGAKWMAMYRHGITLPNENVAQVQGSLWVTGRKWYAFIYFDPRVQASGLKPLLITKVERDNDYIDNILAPKVCAFRDYLRAEYDLLTGEQKPF